MPILGPTYRMNLLDMRKSVLGVPIDQASSVVDGDWGYKFANGEQYLVSAASDTTASAEGIMPLTMPANYISGSAFAVVVGITGFNGVAPAGGSAIIVGLRTIPADDSGSSIILINMVSQPWTDAAYTEYSFAVSAEDAAGLNPGDFMNLYVSAIENLAMGNLGEEIHFSSGFLDLNPA